jgi:hypothetical protein
MVCSPAELYLLRASTCHERARRQALVPGSMAPNQATTAKFKLSPARIQVRSKQQNPVWPNVAVGDGDHLPGRAKDNAMSDGLPPCRR